MFHRKSRKKTPLGALAGQLDDLVAAGGRITGVRMSNLRLANAEAALPSTMWQLDYVTVVSDVKAVHAVASLSNKWSLRHDDGSHVLANHERVKVFPPFFDSLADGLGRQFQPDGRGHKAAAAAAAAAAGGRRCDVVWPGVDSGGCRRREVLGRGAECEAPDGSASVRGRTTRLSPAGLLWFAQRQG